MRESKNPHEATLLDILVDGFEKNEILDGFHWRSLPMPHDDGAARKFLDLVEEPTRWKGDPTRVETGGPRRLAACPISRSGLPVGASWFACGPRGSSSGGTNDKHGRTIRWDRSTRGSPTNVVEPKHKCNRGLTRVCPRRSG